MEKPRPEMLDAYSQLDENGCRVWQRAKDTSGYGSVWIDGKARRAHRVAYEVAHGPIPAGMCVCHKCDNPACINPEHLFLGTHAENMGDMASKGRRRGVAAGDRNGRSKLSVSQAIAIRSDGRRLREISADYGVSMTVVSQIRRGIRWKQLETAHG